MGFTGGLSNPGRIPALVTVALPPPPPPYVAPIEPIRSAREKNMDSILSKYHTGLKSIENKRLIDHIDQESRAYGFDPELILALISTESSFYNWSVSKQGALGMMQIIPATGRAMAKTKRIAFKGKKEALFDPFLNISLGIHYLHSLTEKFPDLETALTAYNFGPTRVRRWVRVGKKLPTRYAKRILKTYDSFLRPNIPLADAT
jgi:soluble lytic murein transglycosylase